MEKKYKRNVIDLENEPMRFWKITKTRAGNESTFWLMVLQVLSFVLNFLIFMFF